MKPSARYLQVIARLRAGVTIEQARMLRLGIGQGMRLAVPGVVIGLIAAAALARWMRG